MKCFTKSLLPILFVSTLPLVLVATSRTSIAACATGHICNHIAHCLDKGHPDDQARIRRGVANARNPKVRAGFEVYAATEACQKSVGTFYKFQLDAKDCKDKHYLKQAQKVVYQGAGSCGKRYNYICGVRLHESNTSNWGYNRIGYIGSKFGCAAIKKKQGSPCQCGTVFGVVFIEEVK